MHAPARFSSKPAVDAVRAVWVRIHTALLGTAITVTALVAATRIVEAFTILVNGESLGDVVDIFHDLVPRWFAGLPVYSYSTFAVHPPATYALLWPVFGRMDIGPARWLWIMLLVAALVWLVHITVRESGVKTVRETAFVAVIPLCMYATTWTLRGGQFGLFVLPLLIVGLFTLARKPPSWRRDVAAAALLLLALVKPTVAAPFIWIALFLPGGLRPVLLVCFGYAVLTVVALSFQPQDFISLFREWQARSATLATQQGAANLHRWLARVGLERWLLPASFAALLAFGWWIYRNRQTDIWLLLGVTAIVARFWTYHRHYDDILLLLTAIALYRLAKHAPCETGVDVRAAVLLALVVAASLSPMRMLQWHTGSAAVALLWSVVLIFLARQAHRGKPAVTAAYRERARRSQPAT